MRDGNVETSVCVSPHIFLGGGRSRHIVGVLGDLVYNIVGG